MAAELSYQEFEVLQQVVRTKGVRLAQLYDDLALLESPEVEAAVTALIRKGLLRHSQEGVVSKPLAQATLEPYKVKRAVILAAGMGERMRPETNTLPKPMVLIHKKRLIETQLDALAAAGITDVTIVRGYLGEAFDPLVVSYPGIKFIDNPRWRSAGAIVSTELAIDLLAGAYLIEGDLFIKNPEVIRPYEYSSSYCGVPGEVLGDWHFYTDGARLITQLAHGDSRDSHGVAHRFIGIMHWTPESVAQLKLDLKIIMQDPLNHQRFIESVPFDSQAGSHNIFVRPIKQSDVMEVDTYEELQALRSYYGN